MSRLTKRYELGAYKISSTITDSDIYEKLADYEDAEEQGLLLRLPCPIGAKIYFVGCDFIEECTFKDFNILKSGVWAVDGYEIIGLFGDCVFSTKEEAEQKLAEMKGE